MKSISKRDGHMSLNIYIMHVSFWYQVFCTEAYIVHGNQNMISI